MKLVFAKNGYLFIAVIILVNALFLLNVDLLPFVDLPNHLGEATVFKYYSGTQNSLGKYYEPVPFYFPNTFHVVFCSLFPTVELGNKIFFILYIGLLIISVFLVTKEINGSIWFGMLSILLTYNMNVTWGFTGFAIAIPTTLLLFYFLLREVQTERLVYTIFIGFLLVLIFLMHAQVALFALILTGGVLLLRYYNAFLKLISKGFLTIIPLFFLLIFWWNNRGPDTEESTIPYLIRYYKNEFIREFPKRGKILFMDNWQLFEGASGIIIGSIFSLLILVPVLICIRRKKGWMNAARHHLFKYVVLLFVCAFLCYLFLPNRLPGQYPIYERFSPLVVLTFIILASVFMNSLFDKKLPVYVVSVAIIYFSFWFEYIYSFNKENKGFDPEFFAGTGYPDKSVGLIYSFLYRGRPVYIHFPNYHLVWSKGLAATKMIDFRFGVVRRGTLGNEIPFYHEWIGADGYFSPEYQPAVDYYIVRGEPNSMQSPLMQAKKIIEKGPWKLYKNVNRMSVTKNEKL